MLFCLLLCLFCKVIGQLKFFLRVFRLTIFKINIGLWLSVRCNSASHEKHLDIALILLDYKAIWETFLHYHSIQRLCIEQELEDIGLVINKSYCESQRCRDL